MERTFNDITFDSAMEMQYYRDVLCPLMESGNVVECDLQKPYVLQPKFIRNGKTVPAITYVADFRVLYRDGHEEVIDIKGYPDSVAKIKRKMFWHTFPEVDYKWITFIKKYGGWIEYDELKRLRDIQKKQKKNREN